MVKQGYKQTEIGIIPEEWELTSIGEIASFQGGSQPDIKYFSNQYKEDKIRLIQIRDYKTDRYITYIPIRLAKRFCTKSDIMIGRYGPPIFQILRGLEGAYNVALIKAIPKNVNKEFLYYILKDEKLFEYIELLSRRSSGQTGVDLEGLRTYCIGLPPANEQQRIAEALSDVDGMISSLEKLIAKKKAVKQGAMQELLTGNKRLSGYTGNWKKYKLDDLLKYEQPTNYIVHNTEYVEQGVPVLTAGKSLLLGYTNESDGIYENLPVIIFDDFVTSSKYITYKFKVKSSAMKMLTLKNDKMSLRLIFELMQMIDFKPYDHQRHWISQYSQFEIYLPEEVEEQNAIASILSDMDNEIEALEQKLAKTRQLKQGMMQQLLTGKIRLV